MCHFKASSPARDDAPALLCPEDLHRGETSGLDRRIEAEKDPDNQGEAGGRDERDGSDKDGQALEGRGDEGPPAPTATPMAAPISARATASARNWVPMSVARAPIARRNPISRVRAVLKGIMTLSS